MLAAILALSTNGVVGHGHNMAWHLPEDLKQFKASTFGHTVILGRTTYDGLRPWFKGEVLPNRKKKVITSRALDGVGENTQTVRPTLEDWQAWAKSDEVMWVIGGPTVWSAAWPHLERVRLTTLNASVEERDDTVFFWPDLLGWKRIEKIPFKKDTHHFCDFNVSEWKREVSNS
jgi:dihydrofolate reductase